MIEWIKCWPGGQIQHKQNQMLNQVLSVAFPINGTFILLSLKSLIWFLLLLFLQITIHVPNYGSNFIYSLSFSWLPSPHFSRFLYPWTSNILTLFSAYVYNCFTLSRFMPHSRLISDTSFTFLNLPSDFILLSALSPGTAFGTDL